MNRERGTTMLELITVLAVVGVLVAVAVPGAASVRRKVSGAEGARRLALVLRAAQAEAQGSASPVRVEVGSRGRYVVSRRTGEVLMSGDLGCDVSTTYPAGVLEFGARGWAGLPGASSPRAGHFDVAGPAHVVTVQLSGCVRCA